MVLIVRCRHQEEVMDDDDTYDGTCDLQDMDDDEFGTLVADHLGAEEPDSLWRELLSAANCRRTREVLAAMNTDVSFQLQQRTAEYRSLPRMDPAEFAEIRREYHDWRSRALTVQRLARRRLGQADAARRVFGVADQQAARARGDARRAAEAERLAAHAERHENEQRVKYAAVLQLARAIARHRLAVLGDGDEPADCDLQLWAVLDETEVPRGDRLVPASEIVALAGL